MRHMYFSAFSRKTEEYEYYEVIASIRLFRGVINENSSAAMYISTRARGRLTAITRHKRKKKKFKYTLIVIP
jgi:hypothetical protein